MTQKHTLTLIPGDGVGPEVIHAVRQIIEATGVSIEWEVCEAGASVFRKGLETGVPQDTIDSLLRTKVALKGPLETPIGYGQKSANVTLRKLFNTYGNIRPIRTIPGVWTPYSERQLDFVIVRENVEDLYSGVEYQQTPSVAESLKIMSRQGCERIIRLAFEWARSEGRQHVHCVTKANIMKLTEGLMKKTFESIALDYPDIGSSHMIVDNCAHQLVKRPEQFDVIVTTNMNGDILSDLSSALIGGLGFAPGANIGQEVSIFEAVHGSAPKHVGSNRINPTAVLLSGVMMLRHLGEYEAADQILHSLFVTLCEDQKIPQDVPLLGPTQTHVSTETLTQAIIGNLGRRFSQYESRPYRPLVPETFHLKETSNNQGEYWVEGIDLFVCFSGAPVLLATLLQSALEATAFSLKLIAQLGVQVYPATGALSASDSKDLFTCRLMLIPSLQRDLLQVDRAIGSLLTQISGCIQWTHVEKLNCFGEQRGYSQCHGEQS